MKKSVFYAMLMIPIMASSATTIEDAYKQALDYEAKVQSYSYQILAKEEDIKQAKSRLYPKIDLVGSATSRYYKLNAREEKRDEQYYTVRLSAELPIYHPEYYNNIEQSKLKYKYADFYLKQLKQELAYNVTDSFMLIVRAKNSLSVALAYFQANKVRYEQIEKMYSKRLANKMDLLASKVTYEQSKIKVNTEKQNLRLAKFKFKNLTSIEDSDIPAINLENIDISKLIIFDKKDDLNSKNIEIKKSNLNINLTKKQIKNSFYGHYPKVDLSASTSKFDTSNIYTDYDNDSRIMLSIKIPLYQGGYVDSQVSKFKYLLSSADEDLKEVKRDTISNYEELSINLKTAQENIVLYKEAITSAKLYLHAVNKGYENGLKNLIDVEDAKTKLFETKFKLIDSVYTYIKSYTSLLNLFGQLDCEKLKQLDDALFIK